MNLNETLGAFEGTQVVRFERLLPGPIERVWAYLTEADKRSQWLASGAMAPQPGGDFIMHFDHSLLSATPEVPPEPYRQYAGGHESLHRLLRVEPPHALAFTWGSIQDNLSEVTFELSEAGDQVKLVLTHCNLSGRAEQLDVGPGWHSHLDVLRERLNGRAPASFWKLFEQVKARYDAL
ncbi:SRPBCC family protein [Paraburkholderia sp. Tr-20389]|uniref:SRPBCC family protein n=1 Tax=Paraburkholderia sp. Tr-20389 TaxID=2703903 RepID=UPI0019805F8C|nr:SRPBCC family protein [Paraburkholderia sp. Tr-20389]MBN3752703.1 SRPBCC family protein [Paraburkholderia sp. Tr-20389]